MELPNESPLSPETNVTNPISPKFMDSFKLKKPVSLKNPLVVGSLVGFVVIFILIATIAFLNTTKEPLNSPGKSDPQGALEREKREREEASRSAQEAAKPLNRLQKAYDEVIGSNSLKKKLTFDDQTGLAVIDYVISSNDGTFIIKTSYENFADLATKVFNTPEILKLSVSSYATKFVDQLGQPNQVTMKLEITRETNEKVNWAVKKYAYKDYPTILTTHEVSPIVDKEYQQLIKSL
jgi:hypothetical protein